MLPSSWTRRSQLESLRYPAKLETDRFCSMNAANDSGVASSGAASGKVAAASADKGPRSATAAGRILTGPRYRHLASGARIPLDTGSAVDRFVQSVNREVDFCSGDDQRGSEEQGAFVRFLAQDPLIPQRQLHLATGAGGWIDVNTGPQAASADFRDALADQPAEPFVQVRAELGGSLLELSGTQQFDDSSTHRTGHRISAERGAVLARLEHSEHIGATHDS